MLNKEICFLCLFRHYSKTRKLITGFEKHWQRGETFCIAKVPTTLWKEGIVVGIENVNGPIPEKCKYILEQTLEPQGELK